jgi:gliding motility-associated lipoprotein GldH
MKITNFFSIAILSFILLITAACNPNKVYEKHLTLSDNVEWKKNDVKRFEIDIKDNSIPYNFSLAFRYAQGYPFTSVKLLVKEILPDGTFEELPYELQLRDEQGKYVGSPGFDIWDSEHLIIKGKTFSQTGKYTYEITHDMQLDPLPLVMEVGIVLEKNK